MGALGATETLIATVSPANATNKSVTWSSSNTSVATVSSNGLVTAVSPGTTTITVRTEDGKKTAICKVTVVSTDQTSHSLALANDGTVWAWGHNGNGRVGDGTTTDRYSPVCRSKDPAARAF